VPGGNIAKIDIQTISLLLVLLLQHLSRVLHQLLLRVQQTLRLLLCPSRTLTTPSPLQQVLEEVSHLCLLPLRRLLGLFLGWDGGSSGCRLRLVDVLFEKFRVLLHHYLLLGGTLDRREGNGLVVWTGDVDLDHGVTG
jgi:hypothetical protein